MFDVSAGIVNGLDERLAAVVDGTDEHPEREHITARRDVRRRLQLDLRSDEVHVRLRHLVVLAGPRDDRIDIL